MVVVLCGLWWWLSILAVVFDGFEFTGESGMMKRIIVIAWNTPH